MRIDVENWIKELKLLDKLQNEAIVEEDNFKLAACFLKLAKDCKIMHESCERNGQMIIDANLNHLIK